MFLISKHILFYKPQGGLSLPGLRKPLVVVVDLAFSSLTRILVPSEI